MTRMEAERLSGQRNDIKDGWSYYAGHSTDEQWTVRRSKGSWDEQYCRDFPPPSYWNEQ